MPGFEAIFAGFIATGFTNSKNPLKGKKPLFLSISLNTPVKIRKSATSELVLNTNIDYSEKIPCNDSVIVNLNLTIKKNEEKVRQITKVKKEEEVIRNINCGVKYLTIQKLAHAKIFFENVIEFDNSNSISWNFLGNIYERENNLSKAKDAYQIACNLDETNQQAFSNLSRIKQNF